MERAFYTLQLRAFIALKLGGAESITDEKIIADFARCIQAVLRVAHRKNVCDHHIRILTPLNSGDTILTFNSTSALTAPACSRRPAGVFGGEG
jgi:hypothetical protein